MNGADGANLRNSQRQWIVRSDTGAIGAAAATRVRVPPRACAAVFFSADPHA